MQNDSYIEWDDEIYSLGITKLDEQHKQLVALINALHQNIGSSDRKFIEKILNTLVQYTQNHFSDEEKILEKTNYNSTEKHKAQHKTFVRRIKTFSQKFQDDPDSSELIESILPFLRDWLMTHILVQDMDYKKYLLGE